MDNNTNELVAVNNNITIGLFKPEIRDVMDYALAEWKKTIQGREVEDGVYSFAYWLFRWSSLIQPIDKDKLVALNPQDKED